MINYLYADMLSSKPTLAHTMFKDRATQFCQRRGWDVQVNSVGEEKDEYDNLNPLYIIVSNKKGHHEASMRLLPTIGKTMIDDHFRNLIDGVPIRSPFIWECTRFCISPNAKTGAATKLMAAAGKLMSEFSVDHFVGIFDKKMLPVYKRIGASPTVINWSSENDIGVGLWEYSKRNHEVLLEKCGISDIEMELIFVNSEIALIGPAGFNSMVA